MKEHWILDPAVTYLNHGSFGAAPKMVLAKQDELRTQLEREPVRFMVRELEPLLDHAREILAEFVGAEPAAIAFCLPGCMPSFSIIWPVASGPLPPNQPNSFWAPWAKNTPPIARRPRSRAMRTGAIYPARPN